MTNKIRPLFFPSALLCTLVCLLHPTASQAGEEFQLTDDITLQVDSTLSFGASFRLQDQNPDIIGVANGGNFNSINYDNGNLNYDKGDVVSAPIKFTQELRSNVGNVNLFGRWWAFYDFGIMDQDTVRTPLSDAAEDELGFDIEFLEAEASYDFDLAGRPATIKGGRLIMNWGESLIIQNGINQINPIRVTALRQAGARLTEAWIPMPAIDLNIDLTDSISLEAFYQFEEDNVVVEPEGTFFSVNDFGSKGGENVFLGFGRAPPAGPPDSPAVFGRGLAAPIGVGVRRGRDRVADDQGQFGLALRWLAEELNYTQFGLYWTHLHSRLPLLSARTGGPADLAAGDFAGGAEYYREFPEDLDSLGLSFNSSVGQAAFAGELAYHIDRPLQVDEVELLLAALSPIDLATGNPVFSRGQLGQFNFGDEITGYREKDVLQLTLNSTLANSGVLGADSSFALVEVGATYIPDLEDEDELRYNGPGTDTGGNPFFTAAGIQPETQTDGFADDFSAGYRLVVGSEYSNVIGDIALRPSLRFAHDVVGTTPGPGGNFVEDRLTTTLQLNAVYGTDLQGGVSYTNYSGADEFNQLRDRDFLSVFTSYSF